MRRMNSFVFFIFTLIIFVNGEDVCKIIDTLFKNVHATLYGSKKDGSKYYYYHDSDMVEVFRNKKHGGVKEKIRVKQIGKYSHYPSTETSAIEMRTDHGSFYIIRQGRDSTDIGKLAFLQPRCFEQRQYTTWPGETSLIMVEYFDDTGKDTTVHLHNNRIIDELILQKSGKKTPEGFKAVNAKYSEWNGKLVFKDEADREFVTTLDQVDPAHEGFYTFIASHFTIYRPELHAIPQHLQPEVNDDDVCKIIDTLFKNVHATLYGSKKDGSKYYYYHDDDMVKVFRNKKPGGVKEKIRVTQIRKYSHYPSTKTSAIEMRTDHGSFYIIREGVDPIDMEKLAFIQPRCFEQRQYTTWPGVTSLIMVEYIDDTGKDTTVHLHNNRIIDELILQKGGKKTPKGFKAVNAKYSEWNGKKLVFKDEADREFVTPLDQVDPAHEGFYTFIASHITIYRPELHAIPQHLQPEVNDDDVCTIIDTLFKNVDATLYGSKKDGSKYYYYHDDDMVEVFRNRKPGGVKIRVKQIGKHTYYASTETSEIEIRTDHGSFYIIREGKGSIDMRKLAFLQPRCFEQRQYTTWPDVTSLIRVQYIDDNGRKTTVHLHSSKLIIEKLILQKDGEKTPEGFKAKRASYSYRYGKKLVLEDAGDKVIVAIPIDEDDLAHQGFYKFIALQFNIYKPEIHAMPRPPKVKPRIFKTIYPFLKAK